MRPGPLRSGKLSDQVADDLRRRLADGEWTVNEKLPTENELADHYGVSRATVRTALHALDRQGLTMTSHGVGTFVTAVGRAVSADLQHLESISQTIVAMGREPNSVYRTIMVRPADDDEAAGLGIEAGAPVVFVEREIFADDEIVAFSRDAIPLAVLPADFDVRSVDGSMFATLDRYGISPRSSITNIHASSGDELDCDDVARHGRRPGLFLLLVQAHFDEANRGVAFSRTWFIEGRFQFNIVRVR